MPRGANKRAAASSAVEAAPAAKRGRGARAPAAVADPVAVKCDAVAKAFRSSGNNLAKGVLSAQCMEMLRAVIPGCLGVPPAERHGSQVVVVDMLARALGKVETMLQSRVTEAEAESQRKEAERSAEAAATDIASEAVVNQSTVVAAKATELEAEANALATAKAELAKELEAQQQHQAVLEATAAEKAECQAVQSQHLVALQEAAWEADDQEGAKDTPWQKHLDILLPFCAKLAVDASLIQALPAVAGRPKAARGAFDELTLAEVGKLIEEQITKKGEALELGAEVTTKHEAAVEAAGAAVEAASAKVAAATEAKAAEEAEQARLAGEEKEKKQTLRATSFAAQKASASFASAEKQMAAFREGPLAAFEGLRSGSVDEPETAADEPTTGPEELTHNELAAPVAVAC